MSFKRYIKAVGTGIKGNRDLSKEEIFDAIEQILLNKATPAQSGALFSKICSTASNVSSFDKSLLPLTPVPTAFIYLLKLIYIPYYIFFN